MVEKLRCESCHKLLAEVAPVGTVIKCGRCNRTNIVK